PVFGCFCGICGSKSIVTCVTACFSFCKEWPNRRVVPVKFLLLALLLAAVWVVGLYYLGWVLTFHTPMPFGVVSFIKAGAIFVGGLLWFCSGIGAFAALQRAMDGPGRGGK